MVQDRPGEQWMTMRGRFDDTEDIKLEVTMFDGYETVPKPGEDSTGEDVRLHSSVLVDISKGDGSDALEFLCSAWPDCLEIQKVYLLGPHTHKMLGRPYLGPDFRYALCFMLIVFVFAIWVSMVTSLGLAEMCLLSQVFES